MAIGADDKATGSLYVDDGLLIAPPATTQVSFEYANGTLEAKGSFEYPLNVNVATIRFLGVQKTPMRVLFNGEEVESAEGQKEGVIVINPNVPFTCGFTVQLQD